MNTSLRVLFAAIIVAMFAMISNPGGAKAQSPTCTTITYVNTSPFQVRICAWGSAVIPCATVPAGATVTISLPFAPAIINGITSAGGGMYSWSAAPPPCINSIQLITFPPPAQCFNVCWDQSTCTATITFAGALPCLNP